MCVIISKKGGTFLAEEIKLISLEKLALYDSLIKEFIDNKVFIGTKEEYETAYANGNIKIGTFVIITDDDINNSGGNSGGSGDSGEENEGKTSSKLGEGVLGYLILG